MVPDSCPTSNSKVPDPHSLPDGMREASHQFGPKGAMPRIPSRTILDAHRQDHLLPLLLQECRSLDLAKSELGWMRNRAVSKAQSNPLRTETTKPKLHQGWRSTLRSMCRARSRGQPLQYILGDQPFGDLDILCRKEVLIPRYFVHDRPFLYRMC